MTECWEWLLLESKKIAHYLCKNYEEADDVASDVLAVFVDDKITAKKIYKEKNYSFLYSMVKRTAYKRHSKQFFSCDKNYSRYQRIIETCEEYHIPAVPQNAYKIAALISDDEYTIQRVALILETAPPIFIELNRVNI